MNSKIKGAIMGAVVGDAIGVPFEFKKRGEIRKIDIFMLKEKGYWNQPLGTWSDDSSMIFCTMEGMLNGYNLLTIADMFCKWKYQSYWTPHGVLFDIGGTTAKAIMNINLRKDYSGVKGDNASGNGSLMRIIPILFYIKDNRDTRFEIIKELSSLTHSNMICIIACCIYIELCLNILDGCDKDIAYRKMQHTIKEYFSSYPNELSLFDKILNSNISKVNNLELSGSGYVVHTLESSLYSFMSSSSYSKSIYKAILFGEDTDTVASITGGLSGLYYGYHKIPKKWSSLIVKSDEIDNLIEKFSLIYGN